MTVTPGLTLPQDVKSEQNKAAIRAAGTSLFLIVFGVILIVIGTFGNFKIKFNSAADVVDAVFTAVICHNALDYGQTQTEAVGVSVMRLVGSVEAVPYFGNILFGDMLAGIDNRNTNAAVLHLSAEYGNTLLACAV